VLRSSDDTVLVYGLGLLAQQQAGVWRYPLPDGLGSLRQWADGAGTPAYAAGYGPFGTPGWQQGTPPSAWGYAGEYQDPGGVLYLRARWYDPAVGRFLTRDPFPGLPLLPATLHPCTYAAKAETGIGLQELMTETRLARTDLLNQLGWVAVASQVGVRSLVQ
jgi:RHS repeat-associated protein